MKENPHLLTLVQDVLTEEIFQYFEIIKIKEQVKEFHIYFDESPVVLPGYPIYQLSSKGFHEEAI